MNYISIARKEYDEIAKKEVQKAFVYSYEESAKTLMDNYLIMWKHFAIKIN